MSKRISVFKQTLILIIRQLYILKSNIKKILMIILLPVATAVIVGIVSGDDVFVTLEDTKSTLFTIVCVSIWIGLFNSIQEICQERTILKREYMSDLKLISYIVSKLKAKLMFSAFIKSPTIFYHKFLIFGIK